MRCFLYYRVLEKNQDRLFLILPSFKRRKHLYTMSIHFAQYLDETNPIVGLAILALPWFIVMFHRSSSKERPFKLTLIDLIQDLSMVESDEIMIISKILLQALTKVEISLKQEIINCVEVKVGQMYIEHNKDTNNILKEFTQEWKLHSVYISMIYKQLRLQENLINNLSLCSRLSYEPIVDAISANVYNSSLFFKKKLIICLMIESYEGR